MQPISVAKEVLAFLDQARTFIDHSTLIVHCIREDLVVTKLCYFATRNPLDPAAVEVLTGWPTEEIGFDLRL